MKSSVKGTLSSLSRIAHNYGRMKSSTAGRQAADDIYSAAQFHSSFISYDANNRACKNNPSSADCPSVKLPQVVNDYVNACLPVIANNVFTCIKQITSREENPDKGTVELGVSFGLGVPVPYAAFKRTYELSPNRDIFIALADANKSALIKLGASIADIESPIYGSEKLLKLKEARGDWGKTYDKIIVEWAAKTGRNRVYEDYTRIFGGVIPPSIINKLGNPFTEAIASWILG